MKKKTKMIPCTEEISTITIECKYQKWWFEIMRRLGKFLKKEKISHKGGNLSAKKFDDLVEWNISLSLNAVDVVKVKNFTSGLFLIKR